ncbi:MAG TPA: hypothetical protein VF169_08125 [Albitalea sp.]|uniref:hypothetical protein n=1 Tax=Piscinibacter sp. TaxID=1903157 RepID=UPI002ED28314
MDNASTLEEAFHAETLKALGEFLNDNAMRGGTKFYGLVGACSLSIERYIRPQNAPDGLKQVFDRLRENALELLALHGMPCDEIPGLQQAQLRELFQDKSRWNVSNA